MTFELNQINKLFVQKNGIAISKYFRISFLVESEKQCLTTLNQLTTSSFEFSDNSVDWKNIFINLLRVPSAGNPEFAYSFYDKASTIFLEKFANLENQLKIPIFKEISHSFRQLAETCEFNACVQKLRYFLPFTQRVREEAYSEEGSPVLAVVNDLICLFLERNDFNQAKALFEQKIEEIKQRESQKVFTASELATFFFNGGKISIVVGWYEDALSYLEKALHLIPLSYKKDRRLCYALMVPLQLARGVLPSPKLIEKYELGIYSGIVDAINNMDLEAFDQALDENMITLVRLGVWDICSKTKTIIYRRILESVCTIAIDMQEGKNKFNIDIELFRRAISTGKEYSMEEAEAILASLLADKLCFGIMADALKKIVLKKDGAFPPLPKS